MVRDDAFINDRAKSNIFQYNISLRCISEKGREVGRERGVGGVKWISFHAIAISTVLLIGLSSLSSGTIYPNK